MSGGNRPITHFFGYASDTQRNVSSDSPSESNVSDDIYIASVFDASSDTPSPQPQTSVSGLQSSGRNRVPQAISWRKNFPWLEIVDQTAKIVKCTVCENSGNRKNEWITGKRLTDWHAGSFSRHGESKMHKDAMLIPTRRQELQTAVDVTVSMHEKQKIALMVDILFCLQEEMPIRKGTAVHSLVNFQHSTDQRNTGGQTPPPVSTKHQSNFSTYTLMKAMNESVINDDKEELRNCKYLCLHIDESTDMTATKFLLIYTTHVGENKNNSGPKYRKVIPLKQCNAEHITEQVVNYFQESQIDLKTKCVMFTSDGASAMLGRHNGVAQRLRRDYGMPWLIEFHCICHREALAVADAYKDSPFFQRIEKTLRDMINLLCGFKNLQGLRELSIALDLEFHRPHRIFEIRWLSRYYVILDLIKSMQTICLFLADGADRDAAVKGLSRRAMNFEFQYSLHAVCDVLEPINRLLIRFQRSDLHPFDAQMMTERTLDQMKDTYLDDEVSIESGQQVAKFLAKVESREIDLSRVDCPPSKCDSPATRSLINKKIIA